jgi:hypothetical protein
MRANSRSCQSESPTCVVIVSISVMASALSSLCTAVRTDAVSDSGSRAARTWK